MSAFSEHGRLLDVIVKHPREAFGSDARIDAQWRELNFLEAPSLASAATEYDSFLEAVRGSGTNVRFLPDSDDTGLDSLYARDASVVTPNGIVLCRMGKAQRTGEPAAQKRAFESWGIPIAGRIEAPGRLEGGDVVWLTPTLVAVGRGYRTNDDGIAQFARLVGAGVEVLTVPLPHWRGAGDVFHLMSIISPVDDDLAVVYSPLMPVPFRERLLASGFDFVEVPEAEFDSMGANVLAVAPRLCVMVAGNPETRRRLEAAGATVHEYQGREISLKGGGGPTCLTRPISRA